MRESKQPVRYCITTHKIQYIGLREHKENHSHGVANTKHCSLPSFWRSMVVAAYCIRATLSLKRCVSIQLNCKPRLKPHREPIEHLWRHQAIHRLFPSSLKALEGISQETSRCAKVKDRLNNGRWTNGSCCKCGFYAVLN